MRLFIAIELMEQIRRELRRVQAELGKSFSRGVSFTKGEQLHITLKFLDQVPEAKIGAVIEKMRLAACGIKPFEMEIEGAGCFPAHGPARILWAGMRDLSEVQALKTLQQRCEGELSTLGFERDNRPFSPHITIARIKVPAAGSALRSAALTIKVAPLRQLVNSFALFSSELTPQGAIHSIIHSQSLL